MGCTCCIAVLHNQMSIELNQIIGNQKVYMYHDHDKRAIQWWYAICYNSAVVVHLEMFMIRDNKRAFDMYKKNPF